MIEAYAASLADAGTVRGLIGPREVPRLWERHLLNCAVLAEAIPESSTVCDIGSGAGLPGLVLAVARPDLRLTLVEPLMRRTTYLSEVVEELGLDTVEVVRGRAEVLHGARTFDIVTSRAVAPLDRLLEWSMPLVADHGQLVAMKGSSLSEEIEVARTVLSRFHCTEPEPLTLGTGVIDPETFAVRVAWAEGRRVGLVAPATSASKKKNSGAGGRKGQRSGGRR
ncbi:16S rRNA (guanine(527)-N(7))-methyltransferase RsmG [Nocardioides sp. JQ2195]|uniref:16S rRNA (guanine(527)-N(7))-methyltransferase RsmG n=1 Tax=Nocardioides sp. JQ2195 TaxID=2592334 RepID=UPI001F1045FB|nr:16S rRNA (guanine(527)-N(7))-methyltransferase RsmG [Nocardioides sp. JQ2195]